MKVTKRIFYSIIFVSSLLILGACGDKDNVDLSEASSVDEDTVTSKYYDEMNEDTYYESMLTIAYEYQDLVELAVKDSDNIEAIKSDAQNYLTVAVTERVQPSTSEEFDIDEYFFKFISNSKSSAEYYIKYANEEDSFYYDMADDYRKSATENLNIATSVANKYGYE